MTFNHPQILPYDTHPLQNVPVQLIVHLAKEEKQEDIINIANMYLAYYITTAAISAVLCVYNALIIQGCSRKKKK